MPKKKNFLGGQQNYNPANGEYEPALKGPNGESPSGFKSFKKQEEKDESFDTTNKKRMGIDNKISEWKEQNPEGKVLEGKSVKEIKENADNDSKEQPNRTLKEKWEDYIENAFSDENSDEEGIEKYNKLIEEIEQEMPFESEEEHKKWLDMSSTWTGEQEWLDLTEKIIARKEKPEQHKTKYFKHPQVEGVWHDTGKTMDRGGKTYKVFENEEGNTWAVSEQFGKQFEEVNEPKHPFKLDKEKYPDVEETDYGFIYNVNGKSITDLKAQAKMFGEQIDSEKDYGFSLTQDGDEVYYDSFDNAYKAAKQNQNIEPKKLASKIKSVDDVKKLFGDFLNEKELNALNKSKNLYVEVSKQYNGGDNYKIIDDEYIKNAFKNGQGTTEDLARYIKDNKDNAYFIKIR